MFGLFGPSIPQVSPQEVETLLSTPDVPVLVDVREPDEFAAGHVPGSRLIPLGSLQARLAEIPRDRDVVMICRSGARSARATQALLEAGYQARNMAGGMLAWRGPIAR